MSLLTALCDQLRRFDEEAFVAMANRGLLRRAGKDLESQKTEMLEATAEGVAISTSGQTVRFDTRGPAQATCSCPSGGVCQHILAACLWLQRSAPATGGEPQPAVAEAASNAPAVSPAEELHAALMAFTPTALSKHASLPGYRWARDFVLDLDTETGVQIQGGSHLVIGFTRPRMTFRYLGGDLGNLLIDASVGKPEKYRVAAVLAYQRAHGLEPAPMEARGKLQTVGLDLGKDHDLAEGADATREESRVRLRASIRQLICECVGLGLSHLSQGIQERYSTLAVWAQGAEYHRLALLLRRIADHVELLLERAGAADEHGLFEELTLAYALVTALESSAARGEAPAHLVGRARSRYESTGAIDLIGLGAMPWRAASGYVGLTMLFWSVTDRAFMSCTDARPELLRGFNPVVRYKSPGPWNGLSSPKEATGQLVRLRDAQTSATGRISMAEGTSATVQRISGEQIRQALNVCSHWHALQAQVDQRRQSLLSEPRPMQDWVALEPARFGAPRFDAARQTLVWPLVDADGDSLNAEVAYSEFAKSAIDHIEALRGRSPGDGTVVIARVRRRAEGLVAEPLSLMFSSRGARDNAVQSIYFDEVAAESLRGRVAGAIGRAIGRGNTRAPAVPAESSVASALRELRGWLMRHAERGIASDSHGSISHERMAHVQRLRESGLIAFTPDGEGSGLAQVLIQMHYLQMQYSRMAGVDTASE